MRRVKVTWTTTEVLEWSATLAVPDDVADDEIEDYFADGNCPTLIEYENPARKTYLTEFTRQLVVLEPATEPSTEAVRRELSATAPNPHDWWDGK